MSKPAFHAKNGFHFQRLDNGDVTMFRKDVPFLGAVDCVTVFEESTWRSICTHLEVETILANLAEPVADLPAGTPVDVPKTPKTTRARRAK